MVTRANKYIDISNRPELLSLVEEVRESNQPWILHQDDEDVASLRSVKRLTKQRAPSGRTTSAEDPLWKLVGTGASQGTGNVSTHKHTYLANAYADRHK